MTFDDWLHEHAYLAPLARVRRRIDEAVNAATVPLPPPDWDDYAEDFATGVPLLQSETPIDLEVAGHVVLAVLEHLASGGPDGAVLEDAERLNVQLQQDRLAPRRIVDWLLGDDSWQPVADGLLRSVGWITLAGALRPVVRAFAEWRDDERWLRRYCPTCGAPPGMAQLVGIDPGRRRFLVCVLCESKWRYGRTGCPFCETESHRLSSLGIEGEAGLRIDYCESCRGYLKTYDGQGDEQVLLADWTSLQLDVLARDRGLTRMATSLYDLEPLRGDAPPVSGADSGRTECASGVPAAGLR